MQNLIFPLSRKEAEKKGIPYSSKVNKVAEFPKRLKILRVLKGVSQQTLADEIGVTKSTISLYEQGENVPDVKNLYKLVKYYEVPYDYLMCETNSIKRENIDIAEETGLTDAAIEVLSRIKASIEEEKYDDDFFSKVTLLIINLLLGEDRIIWSFAKAIYKYYDNQTSYQSEFGEITTKLEVPFAPKYNKWSLTESMTEIGIILANMLSDNEEFRNIHNEYPKKYLPSKEDAQEMYYRYFLGDEEWEKRGKNHD